MIANFIPLQRCGATKNRRPVSNRRAGSTASAWWQASMLGPFAVGSIFGIVVTSIFFIKFSTSDINLTIPRTKSSAITKRSQDPKASTLPPVSTAKASAKPDTRPSTPKFQFYHSLADNQQSMLQLDNISAADLNSKQTDLYEYNVQAGSFVRKSDAETLKATLTLNGFNAYIEAVKLDSGQVWHRVVAGPYKTEHDAVEQQIRLKSIDVNNTLVLKHTK